MVILRGVSHARNPRSSGAADSNAGAPPPHPKVFASALNNEPRTPATRLCYSLVGHGTESLQEDSLEHIRCCRAVEDSFVCLGLLSPRGPHHGADPWIDRAGRDMQGEPSEKETRMLVAAWGALYRANNSSRVLTGFGTGLKSDVKAGASSEMR